MHAESGGPGRPDPPPVPRLGIGTIVRHLQFGVGRIVAHEPGQYVIAFRGGDTRRVALSYDALEVEEKRGDPELDRIRQAMREVLGDHGWIDVEIEMAPRWTGGTLRLIPGKAEIQAKDVPIEVFFKKIVAIRDRLRVLEQKVNAHATLARGGEARAAGLYHPLLRQPHHLQRALRLRGRQDPGRIDRVNRLDRSTR